MPKSPQHWPFPNWTKLGLSRDTPVCVYLRPWPRLLNGHGRLIYLCKSCFNLAKGTWACGLPVW
ncbi:Ribonucleoside-diphosphate reductase large subunit [Gossypium arboreum]|uniref:Ribonucleoside-diphosphate reductase large subunit n=1 Tax=Gossypium arboreum TaxID=29729 RepID=A0A0B0MKH6_GOSAR|nr:Ribonucleoside-diphosphate reductase large subunit [Gossypium arboreum]